MAGHKENQCAIFLFLKRRKKQLKNRWKTKTPYYRIIMSAYPLVALGGQPYPDRGCRYPFLSGIFIGKIKMARSRNIKPGLFKNELLGEADPIYTLLFCGLWCLADKAGRLEDRPKRIKAELFPYRFDLDLTTALAWLNHNLFINRYVFDGVEYIQILKWKPHQSPHHKEVESTIPECPPENKTEQKQGDIHAQAKHESCMDQEQAKRVASTPLIPDSFNLIPDSLNLDTGLPIPDTGEKILSSTLDDCNQIINYLNLKTGKTFKHVESNMRLIRARQREGHSIDDIKSVIDMKFAEWGNDQRFAKFVRPATLFGAEKFNQYVGEIGVETPEDRDARAMDAWINGDDHEGSTIEGELDD